jgi:ankyrin repeat protein
MPPKTALFETLIKACKDGDLAKVTKAVDGGADVNKKTPDDFTPLIVAITHKRKPIVEYLLSKGARVDKKTGRLGWTALLEACLGGSLDIATMLVDAGADVNLKSSEEVSPLFFSIYNKHTPVVEYLLSKGARVDEMDPSGLTPLYKACFDGSLDIASALVDAGADVNLKSTSDYAPLYAAVSNKHKTVMEYLLSKGARIDEKSGPNGLTAIYKACADGSLDIATVLVDAGADVNLKSPQGFAPLFAAIQNNHKPVVEYLLSKGVHIDEKNGKLGLTALHKACINGSLDIATVLVDAEADINVKDESGFTPFYSAVHNHHIPVIKYLLSKRARINEKNGPNDDTVLNRACVTGSLEIVKILVNAGADINAVNKQGKTPLDFAVEKNHQSVIDYLESLQPSQASPQWPGFTQSDISKFDTIFETEAPAGQVPPSANYACCPVCLVYVERSEACMYMSHKCSGYYHKELYAKYASEEGKIYWCTICGRVCFGHRHYSRTMWDAPKPELMPAGAPFEDDCKKTNGGGGLEEKLARFRALRNTAYELQAAIDAGETVKVKQAKDEMVQQCWNATPGFITKRIMTKKAWNRPTTNFRPNASPAGAVAPTFEYPKNDPGAYEAPRILKPGNANFGPNSFTYDDSEPVIQFKHKKADGSMYAHPFINKETLLMFINESGSDWPCFDPACGGHLWPAEVIQALEDPALAATAEEKAKVQAYKERVHGPPQAVGGSRRKHKTQRRRR